MSVLTEFNPSNKTKNKRGNRGRTIRTSKDRCNQLQKTFTFGGFLSIYKRKDSGYYWFKLTFDGKLYQRPTKVKNKREAESIEAAFRTQLAKGEFAIAKRKRAPTLREFSQDFDDFIRTSHANKPQTVTFYLNRLKRLLEWQPLHDARLDSIDEALVAKYVVQRRKNVGIVAVNRELATLRRALHIAAEWKLIQRVPRIRLLPGEQSRDFVLTHVMEESYLAACPQPLRQIATILLDTGLRLGEALNLQWKDIHIEPVGNSKYGWLQVREGKSKNAKRTVPLTLRVKHVLQSQSEQSNSSWVFPGDESDQPLLGTSVAHMHARVRRPCIEGEIVNRFPKEFVLHSLRHTCLTRLGQTGADAFTIMKLAGHSSVTIS